MMRFGTLSLILAMAAGCAGDDDDGAGGGGGGGSEESSCEGSVMGEVDGGFSGCLAVVNHYPDGGFDEEEESWIFTLLATASAGTELDPPLDSIGINFVIAGAPADGAYTSADALTGTIAYVFAPVENAFEAADALSLEVAALEEVGETDINGVATVSYMLSGSLEMTLARGDGGTVTVNAAF
jgi:hypothetical protein